MARKKLKVQAFIKVSEDKTILWYEVLEGGEVVWHIPKEEGKRYRDKMLKNIGKSMSLYLESHPEATMWNT